MKDTVQSIERALAILELLSGREDGLGITELAEGTGLSKSTVHRLLHTLMVTGYIRQRKSNANYLLTMKLYHLGARTVERLDVLKAARPTLEHLRDETREVVHLVLREGNEIVYVDKVESDYTIRMHSSIGRKSPMYCTAVGKAMLAEMPDAEIEALWKTMDIQTYTEHTITEFPAFMEEIRRIRSLGYAMDEEENEKGVRCIGAAVLDYRGIPVAAFSVSGPTVRMTDEKIKAYRGEVLQAREEISREMGYPPLP